MKFTKRLRYLVSLTSLLLCLLMGSVVVNAEVYDDYVYVEETTTSEEDGKTYANGKITYGEIKSMVSTYAGYLQQYSGCTAEEWEYIGEVTSYGSDFFANFANALSGEDCGAFVACEQSSIVVEEGEDAVTISATVIFENNSYKMTLNADCFDNLGPIITSTEFSVASKGEETMGEKMMDAGANTLLGMGTVFIVLIFISFIISLFKYIPAITEKFAQRKTKNDIENVKVEETVVSTETVNTVENDTELIAVIAAAIAASEQVSTDSFVVRSIRRR